MDFFDKVSDAIVGTGKTISKKAKETSDTAKLSYELHATQDKIHESLQSLGKAYFEEYKNDEDAEFQVQMYEIKELSKKVKELEKEIQDVKGTTVCPNCGASVTKGAKFCMNCGEKLPEE